MSVYTLPSYDTHWWLKVAVVMPSASAMPDVSAVSVSPTSAVSLIVGAPVGGWYSLASTVSSMRLNSRLPSPVHIASASSQSRSASIPIVTVLPLESGVTETAHILPSPPTAPTLDTAPPVTDRTWSRSASTVVVTPSLKWMRNEKSSVPPCSEGMLRK